jgi:hypothetical protein
MYWPQIGRFISADSVMGEPGNPASLNRYSYVHNNPYKYTDPSGQTIEYGPGTPRYHAAISAAVKELRATKDGARMLKQLEESKNIFRIVQSDATFGTPDDEYDAVNGKGTSGTLRIDIDREYTFDGKEGEQTAPLAEVLGHELVHASDYDQGTLDRRKNPQTKVRRSEERAVKVENEIRKDLGLPDQRVKY